MYWQKFDVVLTIGRTSWKIQYYVESVYKLRISSSIEENRTKNNLSICPDAYCKSVSIAIFKYATPNNNNHRVSLFML